MPFDVQALEAPGLKLLRPRKFGDERGFFMELYNARDLLPTAIDPYFPQDNLAYSQQGVLRGLHFQAPPHAQAKLVGALRGTVRDVVVDLRRGSPTFGRHFSVDLDGDAPSLLYVPEGFAHGYAVHSPDALILYKVNRYYNKASEGGIHYGDPELGIDWGLEAPQISGKDAALPRLSALTSPFVYEA